MSEKPNTNSAESTRDSALQIFQELAAVVRDERLSELEWEQNGLRFRLAAPRPKVAMPAPVAAENVATLFEESEDEATEAGQSAPAAATSGVEVTSPMSGQFYRKPSPAEPSYVEIGDRVEIGKTLGLIEAMKTYNEIVAEVSGTVAEIRVENAVLVQPGDVLLVISPD